MSAVVFAGAGASIVGGAARLAHDLLAWQPEYDGSRRRHMRERRVFEAWSERRRRGNVNIEEWFSELQASDDPRDFGLFHDLAAVVAHGLAQDMAHSRNFRTNFHSLTRVTSATQVPAKEAVWSVLSRLHPLAVVTTNYDIVIELALRFKPTRSLPGFNYGELGEVLQGSPWFGHGRSGTLNGVVPLYKLHGSLSWERAPGLCVVKYLNCGPAITGKALIVPPVRGKPEAPRGLEQMWTGASSALREASRLIIIGYSAPSYDVAVRRLLAEAVPTGAAVDVFDLFDYVAERYREILPGRSVAFHGPLPDALGALKNIATGARV